MYRCLSGSIFNTVVVVAAAALSLLIVFFDEFGDSPYLCASYLHLSFVIDVHYVCEYCLNAHFATVGCDLASDCG